eukprot:1021410-Pelagomonas_calceolata.AAC.4
MLLTFEGDCGAEVVRGRSTCGGFPAASSAIPQESQHMLGVPACMPWMDHTGSLLDLPSMRRSRAVRLPV